MDDILLKQLIEAVEDNGNNEDIDILFMSDSSESDDDLEEHVKINNFIETIKSYSNRDFKGHFRLNRDTVLDLIDKYNTCNESGISSGRPMLERDLDIYMYLWYLSNTVTFPQLGNLFGVTKSTAWNVIVRVSDFFVSISHEYLRWPTQNESKQISKKFEEIKKIPNIIGAIDGTHIKINAPIENATDYFNRKKYYSISLQLVVDANKRIFDVHCGEPGSMHDSRVLRRSSLFQKVELNTNLFFPPNTFLLGDSAYPLKPWLIPPYRDNGALTRVQRKFNALHSSTRVVVENAIGMLKSRFRRLLNFTEQRDLKLVQKVVYSACVLHNICIMQNDDVNVDPTVLYSEPNINILNVETDDTMNRRDILLEELVRRHIL